MATPKSPKAITIPQVLEELRKIFPGTEDVPRLPIVESVLLAILRENHDLKDAHRVLARFRSDYVDLNELRVSSLKEIQALIGPVANAEERARKVRRFLKQIFQHNYKFDIDGIAKKTFKEAKDDLKHYDILNHDFQMAQVQVQTLGGHAFPVDDRILTMARRLGLVDADADAATLRGILEKNIPKAQILQAIALVEKFVNEVCTLADPKCPVCKFNSFCPGYQLMLNPPKAAPEKKVAKAPEAKKSAKAETPEPKKASSPESKAGEDKSAKAKPAAATIKNSAETKAKNPSKPEASKPKQSPAPKASENSKPAVKSIAKPEAIKADSKAKAVTASKPSANPAVPAKAEAKAGSAQPTPKKPASPAKADDKNAAKAAAKPEKKPESKSKPVPKKGK